MFTNLFGWFIRILYVLVLIGVTAFVIFQPIWSLALVFVCYMLGAIIYGYKYACDNGDEYNSIFIGFIWPIMVLLNWSTFDREKDMALEQIPGFCHLCGRNLNKAVFKLSDNEQEISEVYCPNCEVQPKLINGKIEFPTDSINTVISVCE